jgi:hypothetical protein
MKVTTEDIQVALRDHLQIAQFTTITTPQFDRLINNVLTDLYPYFYKRWDAVTTIDNATTRNFTVTAPEMMRTIAEVRLEPPAYDSDNNEIKDPIRMENYWTEETSNGIVVSFRTYGWRGELHLVGEGTLVLDEAGGVNIPSLEPIVHGMAARHFSRLAVRALRAGDKEAYGIYDRQAQSELNLQNFRAQKLRMPRIVRRFGPTISERSLEAATVFNFTLNLPIQ